MTTKNKFDIFIAKDADDIHSKCQNQANLAFMSTMTTSLIACDLISPFPFFLSLFVFITCLIVDFC